MSVISTSRQTLTSQPTLTFGYCEACAESASIPREECCLIKANAELLGVTVHEESVDGWYFGMVQCSTPAMLRLVKRLAELNLAKETSLEIPDEKDSKKFAKVSGLGEVVFVHEGQTYIATGQPKEFRPRISRARSEECEQ